MSSNLQHLAMLAGINTPECVIWDRGRAGRYGAVRSNTRCHRLVCEWYHGAPQPGMHAAHSCGRPLCVNPKHLRWATPAENIADKAIHGTNLKGEGHNMAKLTMATVWSIREASGSIASIAKRHGISKSQVHRIRTGENWADV